MDIEKEILEIKTRNSRVELDKAWETSLARRLLIVAITYIFMIILFWSLGVDSPFKNALVPTFGYLLSTLGFEKIKASWIRSRRK